MRERSFDIFFFPLLLLPPLPFLPFLFSGIILIDYVEDTLPHQHTEMDGVFCECARVWLSPWPIHLADPVPREGRDTKLGSSWPLAGIVLRMVLSNRY
jgi:hypothetical protein